MFDRTRKFDPFTLVIGILGVILGGYILMNVKTSFIALVVVIAVWSIVEGILKLCDISYLDKKLGITSGWVIVNGVIDIIIGLLMLFVRGFAPVFIWIMLAVWFIMDSLFELWASQYIKKQDKGYFWFDVIIGILGIIVGIILLFEPVVALSVFVFLVAFYFMFFGILLIVRSF